MGNAQGIDISAHQLHTPALRDLDFVICRASYGDAADTRYDYHAANVRQAGLILGAYLFLRNQSPADQVRTFLRVAGRADLFAVDYEKDRGHPHVTPAQTREVIKRIQSTGRKVGLYATQYTMFDAGQDWDWVADWRGERPPGDWKIWQKRGSPLDLDEFDGTAQDMKEWLGMARLVVTQDALRRVRIKAGSSVYSPSGEKIDVQGQTVERVALASVKLGSGGTSYYMVEGPVSGRREITFVKHDDGTDLGPVQVGGPSQADLAAAKSAGFDDAKSKAINAVKGI